MLCTVGIISDFFSRTQVNKVTKTLYTPTYIAIASEVMQYDDRSRREADAF